MIAVLAEQAHGEPAPLEAGDILVFLAIITAAMFFVILAAFGYFGSGDGSGE